MAGLPTTIAAGENPSFLNPIQVQATETQRDRLDISREQFFDLLIAQLKSQDPLEPLANNEFLGQLAQLEMLSSQTKMTEGIESLTGTLRFSQLNDASSMIGKWITASVREQSLDADGAPRFDLEGQPIFENVPVEGLVERVISNNGEISLVTLVPVIGSDGTPVLTSDGNFVTRKVTTPLSAVSEVSDPLLGSAPLSSGDGQSDGEGEF